MIYFSGNLLLTLASLAHDVAWSHTTRL